MKASSDIKALSASLYGKSDRSSATLAAELAKAHKRMGNRFWIGMIDALGDDGKGVAEMILSWTSEPESEPINPVEVVVGPDYPADASRHLKNLVGIERAARARYGINLQEVLSELSKGGIPAPGTVKKALSDLVRFKTAVSVAFSGPQNRNKRKVFTYLEAIRETTGYLRDVYKAVK